jgi:hypothetical protein
MASKIFCTPFTIMVVSDITDIITYFIFRVRVSVYINLCILVSLLLPFA